MPPSKAKAKKKQTYTANQLFTGFMVVTISFLAFAMWPDNTAASSYETYLNRQGVRRSKIEMECPEGQQCRFIAKKDIPRGETILRIPLKSTFQVRSIMDEPTLAPLVGIEASNSTLQTAFINANVNMNQFYNAFIMTFKIWHEMKLGSRSEHAAWIDLLPREPENALYFSDEEAICLDRISFDERNMTITVVKGFAAIAREICDSHGEVYSCANIGANVEDEFKWAYATMTQRVWGDIRQPMLIPVVDFCFPHPELCNPDGDGDVKCQGRDKQFFLQPSQEQGNEDMLIMKSITYIQGREPVYSLAQPRAPWDTLTTFGYADYAANTIPDLEYLSRFTRFLQEHKVGPDMMDRDHPLKECGSRTNVAWSPSTGLPKKELRDCWAAFFYFTEHPEHMAYSSEDRTTFNNWKEDAVEQAKYKFLVWRHITAAAKNVADIITANRGPYCEEKTGRLPVIKAARDISTSAFQRILTNCEKRTNTAFAKWESIDAESAKRDYPMPSAPASGEPEKAEGEPEQTEQSQEQISLGRSSGVDGFQGQWPMVFSSGKRVVSSDCAQARIVVFAQHV